MGIGGHMLGRRKLRQLSTLTGLPLDRAYIRGHASEGVVWSGTTHDHYAINPDTGEHQLISEPLLHWGTCSMNWILIEDLTTFTGDPEDPTTAYPVPLNFMAGGPADATKTGTGIWAGDGNLWIHSDQAFGMWVAANADSLINHYGLGRHWNTWSDFLKEASK
jgi:hypothetical protein